jgi:hypothetical protein
MLEDEPVGGLLMLHAPVNQWNYEEANGVLP